MTSYLRLANYKMDEFFCYETDYAKKYYTDIQNFLQNKLAYKKVITSDKKAINVEQRLIK